MSEFKKTEGLTGDKYSVRIEPNDCTEEMAQALHNASHLVEPLFLIAKSMGTPTEAYAAFRIAAQTLLDQMPEATVQGDAIYELWFRLSAAARTEVIGRRGPAS